jgi:hypothetical protein
MQFSQVKHQKIKVGLRVATLKENLNNNGILYFLLCCSLSRERELELKCEARLGLANVESTILVAE